MTKKQYIPLDCLAARIGLPRTYLRALADNGEIPYLNVNSRLRFDETDVREALAIKANKQKQGQ